MYSARDFFEAIEMSQDYYENFITRNIYNSNRIEGSTLSYADTYAIVFKDDSFTLSKVKPRELYEAINLKYANDYSFNHLNEPLSIKTIIEMNRYINKNIDEREGLRKSQVYIRGADFVPPRPDAVPYQMQQLLFDYEHSDLDDLLKVADFHIRFEHIHPFVDGNGRTGRLLINHMLLQKDMMPVVIKSEDRSRYFELLANYDRDGLKAMIEELQTFEIEKLNDYTADIELSGKER